MFTYLVPYWLLGVRAMLSGYPGVLSTVYINPVHMYIFIARPHGRFMVHLFFCIFLDLTVILVNYLYGIALIMSFCLQYCFR